MVLLSISAFFISASPAANAAETWATDSKTKCKIAWVSDTVTNVSASWTGPVVNGKAEGKGTLTVTIRDKDGNEYKGQADGAMKAGKLDGKVSIKWTEGTSYNGDYKMGVYEGRGVLKAPDGRIYDGEWINNVKTGRGVMKWSDGAIYEGDWKNDARTGKGVFKYPNGETYEGDFTNGEMTGKGVYKWTNGKAYTGDFNNGKIDGKGVFKLINGETYEGECLNGKFNGYGVLKDAGGKVTYEGQWKDGQQASSQDNPEETTKHLKWGKMVLETAKTDADFAEATREFDKAVKLSPANAEAYYYLGMVQEKRSRDDDALKNLKKYLEFSPNGENAKDATKLIDKLEYKAYKKQEETAQVTNRDYAPAPEAALGSAGVTFGILGVTYQSDSNTPWSSSSQFAYLNKAIKDDLNKLLTAKGFNVRGSFNSYDLIPYQDKKAIDLYVVPTVKFTVSPPAETNSIDDIQLGVSGKMTLEIRGGSTHELMWSKSVPFTEFGVHFVLGKITWQKLANFADVGNKNINKPISSVELGMASIDDVLKGIAIECPDVMDTVSKLIDPEEMRNIKKQAEERKTKK